jgi:hypothetical protein
MQVIFAGTQGLLASGNSSADDFGICNPTEKKTFGWEVMPMPWGERVQVRQIGSQQVWTCSP